MDVRRHQALLAIGAATAGIAAALLYIKTLDAGGLRKNFRRLLSLWANDSRSLVTIADSSLFAVLQHPCPHARVQEIFIYPVKSCHATPMKECVLAPYGPEGDRMFVLGQATTAHGSYSQITQRLRPALATVTCAVASDGSSIRFSSANGASIQVRLSHVTGERVRPAKVKLHTKAVDCAIATIDEAEDVKLDEWINKHFPARASAVVLVHRLFRLSNMSGQVSEMAALPLLGKVFHPHDLVSFPDLAPFLLTNLSSLASLNEHLPTGSVVPMDRFRPNLVLEGLPPWAEDRIEEVEVLRESPSGLSSITYLRKLQDCTRCVMTTIDQQAGVASFLQNLKTAEPLNTLKRVRPGQELSALLGGLLPPEKGGSGGGRSPVFGAYFGYSSGHHPHLDSTPTISIGDIVRVTKWVDSKGKVHQVQ